MSPLFKKYRGKHSLPEEKEEAVQAALEILEDVQLDESVFESDSVEGAGEDLLDEGLETRIMPAVEEEVDSESGEDPEPDFLDVEDLESEEEDPDEHLDEEDAESGDPDPLEGMFFEDLVPEESEEGSLEDEDLDTEADEPAEQDPDEHLDEEDAGADDTGAGDDVTTVMSATPDQDDAAETTEMPAVSDLDAPTEEMGIVTAEAIELEAEEVEGTGGAEGEQEEVEGEAEPATEEDIHESFWGGLKEKGAKKKAKKASHAKKKPKGKLVAIIAACVVGVLALLYFAGVWFFNQHFGPSTTIDGVNCALKTAEEAQAMVQEQEDTFVLTITEREEQSETVAGTDIGLQFQPGDDFGKALASQNPWQWFLRYLPQSWLDAMNLDIQKEYQCGLLSYEGELFNSVVGALSALQPGNMAPPVNAKLHFDQEQKKYDIVEEVLGTTLDVDKTLLLISERIMGYRMDLDLDEEGCYVAPTLTADSEEMAHRKELCETYFPFAIDYDLGGDRVEQLNGETFLSWCVELPKPESEEEPEPEVAPEEASAGETAETAPAGAKAPVSGSFVGTAYAEEITVESEVEGQGTGDEAPEGTATPAPTPTPTENPDRVNTPSSDKVSLMIDYQYIEVPASVYIGTTYNIPTSTIQDWVHSFAGRVNTVGSTRTFITRDTGESTSVSGGYYGWALDEESETKAIIETLLSKESVAREPIYSSRAAVHAAPGEPDWGDTYIEVSIASQQLYLIVDGELIYQCGVVTGLPNGYKNTPAGVYDINSKQSPSKLVGEPLPGQKKPEYETWVTYWMAVVGGAIGIHDATWQYWGFGGDIYTWNGSHGCINVSYDSAAYLYGQTYVGQPVIIH